VDIKRNEKWEREANLVSLWVQYIRYGFAYTDHRKRTTNLKRIRLAVHEFTDTRAKWHLKINLKTRRFRSIRWWTSFRSSWHA
jgi:hypothetical protein